LPRKQKHKSIRSKRFSEEEGKLGGPKFPTVTVGESGKGKKRFAEKPLASPKHLPQNNHSIPLVQESPMPGESEGIFFQDAKHFGKKREPLDWNGKTPESFT